MTRPIPPEEIIPDDWESIDDLLADDGPAAMFDEPVVVAEPRPLPARERRRAMTRLKAERRTVVVAQRRAAVNGADTAALAAALAQEAGNLWVKIDYLKRNGAEMPAEPPAPPRPRRAAPVKPVSSAGAQMTFGI